MFTSVLFLDTDWFQPVALGIEEKLIRESQMAVSSKFSTSGVANVRLNFKTLHHRNTTTVVRYGGWLAALADNDPWFQVDFVANATVSAILTQGLDNGSSWVTKYAVAYGYNKFNLKNYSVNGQIKVQIIVLNNTVV